MLKEFYNFIAQQINDYFQKLSIQGSLLKGESFSLKLDNEEMVIHVKDALRDLAKQNHLMGCYHYPNESNSIYSTFTLCVQDDEIIIAAQTDGMTNDFLCATLRNAANDQQRPLLMISANLIDSAKSGSKDLSARDMPFYADVMIREIRNLTDKNAQLTAAEKRILHFELDRKDADVFSDKNSLYEYKDLLAILNSGKISDENYTAFRLFPMDAKTAYQQHNQKQLDQEIQNNNKLFEQADRGFRFGNLDAALANILEENIIEKIEKEQKLHPETWSQTFPYAELAAAMEKKKDLRSNPLNIENTDLSVCSDSSFQIPENNELLFIRNEGSQTAKKRTKNVLIFNPEKHATLYLKISCNIRILSNWILPEDTEVIRKGKDIIFGFRREGLSFHKLQILDERNGITYHFKICILDLMPDFLIPTIKRQFIVDYKKTRKKNKLKIVGVGTDLIFNANRTDLSSAKLDDQEYYTCTYETKLHLFTTEEELSSFGSGIEIEINFSGLTVPFILFPDEVKSVEITGRKILKDKFFYKNSFEFDHNKSIYYDTQEYYAKSHLLRELRTEQFLIDHQIFFGRCLHFSDLDDFKIQSEELCLPENLKKAYLDLLTGFQKEHTVPTLAYLNGRLLRLVQQYLEQFDQCFAGLTDGMNFSLEQEHALFLGTLEIGEPAQEILLTPFHPLNLKYQLALQEEHRVNEVTDLVASRLHCGNLLPYIRRSKHIYRVSDQMYSLEWKYYAPVENKKYRGNRKYVPKLIEDKIMEFVSHFQFIFDAIHNRTVRINLINMGDCSEVFIGICQFFIHAIQKNPDIELLKKLQLHIYTDHRSSNVFLKLKNAKALKEYLDDAKLSIEEGVSMNNLEGILSKNIECYFHEDSGKDYTYAHLTFYEMESEITSEQAAISKIETGISLGGMISGVPSSKYGHKYRTGFGAKYADQTSLIQMASKYNALIQVGSTGNPYHQDIGISTQIDTLAEKKMDHIYDSSNWVVFIDPKVDLDFFSEKTVDSNLLIIHYSDQYTTSSGYDAITVTEKSYQYTMVIQEFLKEKGHHASIDEIHNIINLFNAINGSWLLRLISSKKGIGKSYFGREKISIVAAIKFMLAFLKHPNLVWVPVSLEELLRVSKGAGLSQGDGLLSAKNLGFEKGPASDDLLFIGIDYTTNVLRIYLYPVEVKTGNNEQTVLKKAVAQVSATASGFATALYPAENIIKTLPYKINRNFLMQLLITSCKKMAVYHVDDTQDWTQVLDRCRCCLLNEAYVISTDLQEVLGIGAVLSFRKRTFSRKSSFYEGGIQVIEMPEADEFELMLDRVGEIYDKIHAQENELVNLETINLLNLKGDLSKVHAPVHEHKQLFNDPVSAPSISDKPDLLEPIVQTEEPEQGMHIMFGTNLQDQKPVIWKPNDTRQLFHTNTGIIGTMGTGKTQFTKSLITQLYLEQVHNIDHQKLGILIFDYKGDYNESKTDFVQMTNANILKPYHLPFNPLSLTKSKVFKPLLPVHTANAFKDTLSKVFGLGAKQQNTLFQCITDAYTEFGILPNDPETWDRNAPTFAHVYQKYEQNDAIKKNDSLAAAMEKLQQFQVFESNPDQTNSLFDILNGVVVIDLSGYDTDIQNLIVAITLDLFYVQMQAAGSSKMNGTFRQLTKLILVDEADNFMSEGFPALKKILKEGREFGVGTILSTQFLKHFGRSDDDYAKYILSWIVHNVADLKGSDVDYVFKTETKSAESLRLFKDIKALKIHHSIVKIGTAIPVYMRDQAFWELFRELN